MFFLKLSGIQKSVSLYKSDTHCLIFIFVLYDFMYINLLKTNYAKIYKLII